MSLPWRDNLHRMVIRVLKELPPVVTDAIDAAYVAGMDNYKKCSRCERDFESGHHRHIIKDKIYHTRCYKNVINEKQ